MYVIFVFSIQKLLKISSNIACTLSKMIFGISILKLLKNSSNITCPLSKTIFVFSIKKLLKNSSNNTCTLSKTICVVYDCIITQMFATKYRYNNQRDAQNVRCLKVKILIFRTLLMVFIVTEGLRL